MQDSVVIQDVKGKEEAGIRSGGGGIMPDVFVPADTTYYSPFYKGGRPEKGQYVPL